MGQFSIEFYQAPNGSYPAKDFLESQDVKMRAKLERQLYLLQEVGNALREPESKFLSDGIFEIRAKQGSDITRILYFFFIGKKIILTNGFVKKTDKTPQKEIDKAKKYKADYEQRRGASDGI